MSITYPLSLPNSKQAAQIELRTANVVGMTRGPFAGNIQTITHPGQWWEADVVLPPLKDPDDYDAWIAFLVSLRGRHGSFLMGDPSRSTPRGSAASTPGSPVVNGADQTGQELAISGMPTGVTGYLKKCDYIQIGTGSASKLFMLLENLDSDGSGEGTAVLWPNIQTAFSNGVSITVSAAKGVFKLDTNSIGWLTTPGPVKQISFKAMESI